MMTLEQSLSQAWMFMLITWKLWTDCSCKYHKKERKKAETTISHHTSVQEKGAIGLQNK